MIQFMTCVTSTFDPIFIIQVLTTSTPTPNEHISASTSNLFHVKIFPPRSFRRPYYPIQPPYGTAEGQFQAKGNGEISTDRISPLHRHLSDETNDKSLRQAPYGAQILAKDDALPIATQKARSVGEERRSRISGGGDFPRDNIIGTSPASGRGNLVEDVAVSRGRADGRGANLSMARGEWKAWSHVKNKRSGMWGARR